MEIQISRSNNSKLLTYTSQPYLIVNLIGSFFLLTKASHRQSFGKNINFQHENKSFYSTFARHVNLSYAGKLSELIESLQIMIKPALQHEWLMLYEIHDFETKSMAHYRIQIPAYGAEVLINSSNNTTKLSRISNLFRLNGQTFYFLSSVPSSCQQFTIITDKSKKILYGLTYFVKDVIVCLPFHSICSQKPCPLNILPEIRPLLQGTCYLRFTNNYCTGFVLNQKTVISARHLLPFEDQKVGLQVGVRFYPFNEEKLGFIRRIGQGNVDIIQIIIPTSLIVKRHTATVQKSNLYEMKIDYEDFLGKEIVTLGFGKFSYFPKIFNKIDAVMPTVESGIISKVINLGGSNVFIKTDASLYNGFSGCGIWIKKQLIAMAVFILKNKNTNSSFNRHNFSYSLSFILRLLDKNDKDYLVSELNDELVKFDKIQTRFRVPLVPKL